MSALLVVTLTQVVARPQPAAAAVPATVACPASRPDRASALTAARLCRGRVEISGEKTQSQQVWAESAGTLTADQSAGIARFQRGGSWVDVDLTLAPAADGSIAPVAHPFGLTMSGAVGTGWHQLAAVGSGRDRVGLDWSGPLPQPVLSGAKATYVDALPGIDVVVQSLTSGFEQFIVVKNRAALARLNSVSMALHTGGPAARTDGRGGLLFTNAKGAVVARSHPATMWDAATDPSQAEAIRLRPVGLGLTAPRSTDRNAGIDRTLTLSPDASWLADPARQFPITIDPDTVVQTTSFDTYVATGTTSDLSGWTTLALGTQNSGTTKRLAYLNFTTAGISNVHFNWATVKLWGNTASTCASGTYKVFGTITNANNGTRWTNRPNLMDYTGANVGPDGAGTPFGGSIAPASGCTGQWLEADATGLFQYASDHHWGEFTVALAPYWDNTNIYYKQFRSAESGTLPHVTLNWNDPPQVSGFTTTPTTSGCVVGAGRPYLTSKTPQLAATVTDSDTTASNVTFEWSSVGGSVIGSTTVSGVPSGSVATATVPVGAFTDGGTYSWRVSAVDPAGLSSGWSSPCEFTVDSVAPSVPFVASTQYPENGRGTASSGQFTFTPATADTDVTAFTWQLDTDTSATTVAGTSATTVTITPSAEGHRTLTVRAKDKAGNLSAAKLYVFEVGRAGIAEPRPGATAIKRMKISLDVADPTLTRATLQYRRGPGGAVYDIPLANLSTATGGPITSYPVTLSTLGGNAIWNAIDTLGVVGGLADVRACLWTATDSACSYQSAWVSTTVDPSGDTAAGTGVGPGSVNLLSGDYSLTSTDVDELGLSVSRTASSRDPGAGWIPQGQRLSPNQQQISTDLTGIATPCPSAVSRATGMGQGSSTDSVKITTTACGSDSYVYPTVTLTPGKRYRFSAWIFVPASTGLDSGWYGWGQSIIVLAATPSGAQRFYSGGAGWVDGWQQLTVDIDVPTTATSTLIQLFNGSGTAGKTVYWDNLSLRELVAPFGPSWRGGTADATTGSDYTSLEFPSPDVAQVNTADGSWLTFAKSTSGQFFSQPGAESLSLVNVDANTYELRSTDGIVVRFTQPAGAAKFMVTSTFTTEANSTTSYVYDTTDNRTLVSRVVNPTEPGVTGCAVAAPTVPGRGCEVLEYLYATTTTATSTVFGDVNDQITAAQIWTWDPTAAGGTGAMTAVEVAHYAYDDAHRLRQVWDPRITPTLVTAYEYDSAGHVTKITPVGELPWMFDYGTIAADPSNSGRLQRVRRTALLQGSPTTTDGEIATRMVYDVPLTRGAGGPNDMDATTIATWAQTDMPIDATAIFGPEDDPVVVQATSSSPGQNGYGQATVHYLNASAQEVNTATTQAAGVAGAAIDTTVYDRFGNTVWTLEATNRLLALGQLPNSAAMLSTLDLAAVDTASRAGALATVHKYSADGVDLLDTTGPTMTLVLEQGLADPDGTGPLPALSAGSTVVGRAHTVNVYDEGKPDGATYHLQTTTTSGATVSGYPDGDTRVTTTGYDPDNGSTSGWVLKAATSVTTDAGVGGAHLTAHTVFDSAGRATKSWGIDSTGSDAHATLTIFYTAGTNTQDAACGNKPEWAGNACVTKEAGPVTGHDPARMTTDLAEKRVTSFTRWGDAAVVTETVAGTSASRTTTTTYDTGGRVVSVAISSTGDGAVAVPTLTTDYSTVTGQVTATHAGTATITRAYDLLGRAYRYTDADGGVTTNEYDRYGKPSKVSDPTGYVTFTYDRTQEPRGFVTSVTDSVAGTFSAGYSPDGQLTTLHYPNGITRTDTLDTNLDPVGRSYTRDSDSAVIYAESVVTNSQGQAVNQTYTGGSRSYSYDRLGRLTATAEQTDGSGCTTRTYAYDNRTNRTNRSTYAPAADNSCRSTGTPDATSGHVYDTADRITDAGYTYDAFGRITAVPGGLTNTYYANDLVAGQIQGNSRQDWTLDPSHRFRSFTTASLDAGTWTQTASRLNHYGDDSDSPRWIVENTGSGTVTRMVSGPDGTLAATTTATAGSAQFQLVNLHGDVVTTADPSAMPAAFNHYDEFGVPAAGQAQNRYGWLGGKERSAEALGGVILMGVRLYQADTGRFLQPDPVAGGSATAYDYCNGDPVNAFDLAGTWPSLPGWAKKTLTVVAVVASVASIIPGPIGMAAAGISAVSYAATGNWKEAAIMAAGIVLAAVGAGAAVLAVRAARVAKAATAVAKVERAASGAENAANGARLAEHLRQLEKYGQAGCKQLESGRFRYYGYLRQSAKQGVMAGRRLVREWNPANGAKRTWHETLDHAGNIRQVRPVTGGPKVHYVFDALGRFTGRW